MTDRTETRTIRIKAAVGKYGHQGQWLTHGCGYVLGRPLADFLVAGGFAEDSDDANAVDMTHLTLDAGTRPYRGGLKPDDVVSTSA